MSETTAPAPPALEAAPDEATAPPQAPETARAAQPLLLVHLRGTQAEMGRRHGELLRGLGGYEDVLNYYPRMPEIILCGPSGGGLGARMTAAALKPLVRGALVRLERARPAIYRERTQAFAEGLGHSPELSRFLLVMDVLQNVVGLAGRLGMVGPSRRLALAAAIPACSSLMLWGRASEDGALRHARNFDFPGAGIWEQRPTLVFCTPEQGLRYGFVTTRGADVPGVTAFNEAGLTLSAHTCFHRQVSFSGAGIVDLGHEIVRRAESLADAERIARERPIASSWSLCISSAHERSAVVLEIGAGRVEAHRPGAGEDFLAQTNRYRTAPMQAGQVAPSAAFIASSEGRYRMLRRSALAASGQEGLGVAGLQALLGSHECPDVPGHERPAGGVLGQGMSVKSIVCEPEAQRLHVSVGLCPTGLGPWALVPWSWDEPEGARLAELETQDRPSASRYASGSGREGYQAYLDAVRIEGQGGEMVELAACLQRAAQLDPQEPTYRLMAGALRLQGGDAAGALQHFRSGLERERAPFARGQLLLWASRAADASGQGAEAQALRDELLALEHPLLGDHHEKARRERRRPFPRSQRRRIRVHASLPEVTVG
jgi:hypothetical protein